MHEQNIYRWVFTRVAASKPMCKYRHLAWRRLNAFKRFALWMCLGHIFQTYSNIFRTYTKISGTVIEQSYQWRVAQLAIHHPHVLPHDRHVLGLISIFSSLIVCLSRSIAISACLIRSIESRIVSYDGFEHLSIRCHHVQLLNFWSPLAHKTLAILLV